MRCVAAAERIADTCKDLSELLIRGLHGESLWPDPTHPGDGSLNLRLRHLSAIRRVPHTRELLPHLLVSIRLHLQLSRLLLQPRLVCDRRRVCRQPSSSTPTPATASKGCEAMVSQCDRDGGCWTARRWPAALVFGQPRRCICGDRAAVGACAGRSRSHDLWATAQPCLSNPTELTRSEPTLAELFAEISAMDASCGASRCQLWDTSWLIGPKYELDPAQDGTVNTSIGDAFSGAGR